MVCCQDLFSLYTLQLLIPLSNSSLILMASHSEGLLRKHCDKAILMEGGEITFCGSISEAFKIYRK